MQDRNRLKRGLVRAPLILMIGYVPQYCSRRFVQAIEFWLVCFEMLVSTSLCLPHSGLQGGDV